jgi:hypothetical protein
MRTISKKAKRGIAVEAERTKPIWKASLDQMKIELFRSSLFPYAKASKVCSSVAVHMINRQELIVRLTAACTFVAVGIQDRLFDLAAFGFQLLADFRGVLASVFPAALAMAFAVGRPPLSGTLPIRFDIVAAMSSLILQIFIVMLALPFHLFRNNPVSVAYVPVVLIRPLFVTLSHVAIVPSALDETGL